MPNLSNVLIPCLLAVFAIEQTTALGSQRGHDLQLFGSDTPTLDHLARRRQRISRRHASLSKRQVAPPNAILGNDASDTTYRTFITIGTPPQVGCSQVCSL